MGLLLIGDDGPDVADEESHGPEGTADVPGEGSWGIGPILVLLVISCLCPRALPELEPGPRSMSLVVCIGPRGVSCLYPADSSFLLVL